MTGREQAEGVIAMADLVGVGEIGAAARKAKHGARVTYGRVLEVANGLVGAELQLRAQEIQAGEIRITGTPSSAEEAIAWTKAAKGFHAESAENAVLTGFSLVDLLTVCGGDHMVLVELSQALRASGLEGIADVPVDKLGDDPAEVVRAVLHGGLTARRATVTEARFEARPALIERAESIQRETNAFAAFAPLPRVDPIDVPSTGYDDVKTIAITRLLAPSIACVQVDWVLYGPKLAQVAIESGADDIDGVAAMDVEKLGVRRSPKADIERQIRSAFAEPAERNGRYELV
jgi:aminodeoxyfutalosine synthase